MALKRSYLAVIEFFWIFQEKYRVKEKNRLETILELITLFEYSKELFDNFRMQYFSAMVWYDHSAIVFDVDAMASFLPIYDKSRLQ